MQSLIGFPSRRGREGSPGSEPSGRCWAPLAADDGLALFLIISLGRNRAGVAASPSLPFSP